MDEPQRVNEADVLDFHAEQLAEFGGMAGIRDTGSLTSALNRPRNVWAYSTPQPDMARLAASYTHGVAKNHPFFDGNKHTALIVCHTFLRLNGWKLVAPQLAQVQVILDLAAGTLHEEGFTEWLPSHLQPAA